jgi:hypothetical protein
MEKKKMKKAQRPGLFRGLKKKMGTIWSVPTQLNRTRQPSMSGAGAALAIHRFHDDGFVM